MFFETIAKFDTFQTNITGARNPRDPKPKGPKEKKWNYGIYLEAA